MSAILEFPKILVDALRGFNFTGKPLWRLGEGLDHMQIELTYKLSQPDDELIDQQARAVRKTAAKRKKNGQKQRQRQQCNQQQSPPSETLPPTAKTVPAMPPATISYQQPAMTKIPAPAQTSTIQRPPPPAKIHKQSRLSEPVLTSSPIANQPEPMTISPDDPVDLNIAISGFSSTFDPETAQMRIDKKLTTGKLDMYNFKKLFRHYDSPPDCRFVQKQRKPCPNSDDIDLPAYFVKFTREPYYSVLKGPHSRHHCEKRWNFMVRAATTSRPEAHPYLLAEINKIYKFAEDGAVV